MKTVVEGEKWCGKCNQWKKFDCFSWNSKKDNLLQYSCKECQKLYMNNYQQKNKEILKRYWKNYYHQNIDKIKVNSKSRYERNKTKKLSYQKQYHKDNKENIRLYKKRLYRSPLLYDKVPKYLKDIFLYEETRRSYNNLLECKCDYCGKWFPPLRLSIRNRINAIYGKTEGESRLYCSDVCKQECPIYGQVKYSKDFKPATSREVQPQLRHIVFERDNYTCQKCSKHKDELEVGLHCHHIDPVINNPVESADIDNCVTLCENCHKWIHQNIDGCGYGELKRYC